MLIYSQLPQSLQQPGGWALCSFLCYVPYNPMASPVSWVWRTSPLSADERETTLSQALALFPWLLHIRSLVVALLHWEHNNMTLHFCSLCFDIRLILFLTMVADPGAEGTKVCTALEMIFMTWLWYFFSSDMHREQDFFQKTKDVTERTVAQTWDVQLHLDTGKMSVCSSHLLSSL